MYIVYWVKFQPGFGWPRGYVGSMRAEKWGGDAVAAVEERVQKHLQGGKLSAAWLRCCKEVHETKVLHTCSHQRESLVAEL